MSEKEKSEVPHALRSPRLVKALSNLLMVQELIFFSPALFTADAPHEARPVAACHEFAEAETVRRDLAKACIASMQHDRIALVDLSAEYATNTPEVAAELERQLAADTSGLLGVSVEAFEVDDKVKTWASGYSCVDAANPLSGGPGLVRMLYPEDMKEYDRVLVINSTPDCGSGNIGAADASKGDAQLFDQSPRITKQLIRDGEHEILHLYRLGHAEVLRKKDSDEEALEEYIDTDAMSHVDVSLERVFGQATRTGRGEGIDSNFSLSQGGQYGEIMGQPSQSPLDDRLSHAFESVLGYPYEVAGEVRPGFKRYSGEPVTISPEEGNSTVVGVKIDFPSPLDKGERFYEFLVVPMLLLPTDTEREIIVGASVYLADDKRGKILKLGNIFYKSDTITGETPPTVQTYHFDPGAMDIAVTFDGASLSLDAIPSDSKKGAN